MARNMHSPPFYGRGVAFPFRVDTATGSVVITEGRSDSASVALQYVHDRYLPAGELDTDANLIAESIMHIVLCREGEHDTLPEFGGKLHFILHDPNHPHTWAEAETYFWHATVQWEHRASIPDPEGVEWGFSGPAADRGELGLRLMPRFLLSQHPANLVAPFVTPRQARLDAYPSAEVDEVGHDYESRYYQAAAYEYAGERMLLLPLQGPDTGARPDDEFVQAGPLGESWLTLAWRQYHDIRHWWRIFENYAADAAAEGAGWECLDPCGDAPPNTWLRCPSETRVLMEGAA